MKKSQLEFEVESPYYLKNNQNVTNGAVRFSLGIIKLWLF